MMNGVRGSQQPRENCVGTGKMRTEQIWEIVLTSRTEMNYYLGRPRESVLPPQVATHQVEQK
jgi:hypothetical protein